MAHELSDDAKSALDKILKSRYGDSATPWNWNGNVMKELESAGIIEKISDGKHIYVKHTWVLTIKGRILYALSPYYEERNT